MRKLLHQDMQMFSSGALLHHLSFMRTHPAEPLITIIDYTSGAAWMVVKVLKDVRAEDTTFDVLWDEHVARAAQSGRMELHVMVVLDGNRTRRVMFPQRSDTSAFHDGLIRILNEVSPDLEAQDESKMGKLWEATENPIQIHH
jgi:aromatic ring-opening dioxygenase catalytic subunit (LigB family)